MVFSWRQTVLVFRQRGPRMGVRERLYSMYKITQTVIKKILVYLCIIIYQMIIYAESFDIVGHYEDITHNTWVEFGNDTWRLVFDKNGEYILEDTMTSADENVGYLKKVDGKVIFHKYDMNLEPGPATDIEIKSKVMMVYLAVAFNDDEEGSEKVKLKVGHYLWQYYEVNRNFAERRIQIENIILRYDPNRKLYVVFIKYLKERLNMEDENITRHSETKPDNTEGYRLKL